MLKVYLSSTYEDLRPTRETVYRALRKIRCDLIAIEDYVAQGVAPLQKCRADVRSCDIYVGIIGWGYGYVPPGESLSITELEFQEATREPRKECLLFLADETFRPADVDLAELTKIKALRAKLQLEVAHLQWDATSWLSQPDGLGTARIRPRRYWPTSSGTAGISQPPGKVRGIRCEHYTPPGTDSSRAYQRP